MRFGIRTLLIVLLLAAAGLAEWRYRADRAKARERAMESLLSVPDPLGKGFNPVDLVRAVNSLHSLGRSQALVVLREFSQKNPNEGYSSPHQALDLVVPLLFDRRNPEDKFPVLNVMAFVSESEQSFMPLLRQWGNPVVVENGIPFHTVIHGIVLGNPGDQSHLIDWAEQAARFREAPMVPADDPFAAVEELIGELQRNDRLSEFPVSPDTLSHLRLQVFRSIANIPGVSPVNLLPESGDLSSWHELRDKLRSRNLRWDQVQQGYVADGGTMAPVDPAKQP